MQHFHSLLTICNLSQIFLDITRGFWFNMHHFGVIAQLVEQRIENPCVGSSILPLATILINHPKRSLFWDDFF